MTAIARPTITVVEKDSTGKPAPPLTVIADNVFMDGDSLIYGGGQVVITRPADNLKDTALTATGDSAFIDQGTGDDAADAEPEGRRQARTVHSRSPARSSTCTRRTRS